ncbi:MAG: alpha/beta fold hydrolase [Promethearchaeota archaeon]
MFAEVNGIKICYEISGEGQPIFLVHGFGSKKECWIAQIPELSKYYRVIYFDNRGAGKSDRPEGGYTMETFADDIAGLMDFLGIDKAKAVIGWSLGGMIVQHFALKYPEWTEKIALLFTNYKGTGGELYKQMRIETENRRKEDPKGVFWESTKLSFLPKFRREMRENPKKKFYGLWSAEDLMKIDSEDTPTEKDIINQANALEEHNTYNRLHELKMPVLLLAGSHDKLTPKSAMEEMHNKIPNSIFKVIDKAGHGAPLSHAPDVNKILLEFLGS